MPPQYRKYNSDEEKADSYSRRIFQAETDQKKWHKVVEKDISRYNAVTTMESKTEDGHNVGVPTGTSIIDTLYSSMTAVEVDITVSPKGNGTDDQAYVATAALAQEWDRCKVPTRSNKAVKDALVARIGWVKVGYEFYEEEQEVPRTDDAIAEDIQTLLTEAYAAGDMKNVPNATTIMDMVPISEKGSVVLSDRIVFDYVPWDMVLWDPTAKQVEDIQWVAQKMLMHPAEVKQSPAFKEYCASKRQMRKLNELEPDTTIRKDIVGVHATPDPEDERVTVYVMWDFQTGTVCTFVKDKKFLLNETVNPFALNDDMEDKSPFVPLILRDTPSRLTGVSEMDVMRDTLAEMDIYHSRLGTYLERMAPKVIAKARAFTPAGKEALKSQDYGAVIELEEGFEPSDIQPFSPPTMMSEMYSMPEKLDQAARDATGMNELMRGLFPDRKRTATETTEVVSASAARQSEKRTQLENFYKAIARRFLQLMQMFYEKERMVRLVDEAGEFAWEFNSDDISFEFDLELALTPKEAKSWQSRSDKALATLNILGPMAQPGPDGTSPVDVTELLRYVLAELNIPRRIMYKLLNLPEEQQKQALGALQTQAAQANAAAGLPRADMVPGPLNEQALAAATNQGTIPPEVLAAAGGGGPLAPESVERVSEGAGVAIP